MASEIRIRVFFFFSSYVWIWHFLPLLRFLSSNSLVLLMFYIFFHHSLDIVPFYAFSAYSASFIKFCSLYKSHLTETIINLITSRYY